MQAAFSNRSKDSYLFNIVVQSYASTPLRGKLPHRKEIVPQNIVQRLPSERMDPVPHLHGERGNA